MEKTWFLIRVSVANRLATNTHHIFNTKDEIKTTSDGLENVEEIIQLFADGKVKSWGKKID